MAQSVGRNDPCPCRSGRKFKRCHGRVASVGGDPVDPTHSGKPAKPFDEELGILAVAILDALEDVAAGLKTDPADRDDRFRKICSYHFAFLMHGVSRAALALAKAGSRWPIFALRRLAFEYFLKAFYFDEKPDEAVLFVASMFLVQRRLAMEWAAADQTKDFRDRIRLQDQIIAQIVKDYPDVARAKTKKGKPGELDVEDTTEWEPKKLLPLAIDYFKMTFRKNPEMRDYAIERYELAPDTSSDDAAKVFATEKWIMNAHYPSQQIHATALSLVPTMSLERYGGFARFSDHFDDPNPLVWGCLGFSLGVAEMIMRQGSLEGAERINELRTQLNLIGDRLGIE